MFLYDGITLVLANIRAKNRKEIQNPRCKIDICVIPRERPRAGSRAPNWGADQCTVQYALYWLVYRGWRRLSATLEDAGHGERDSLPVTIGRYTRAYEEWSGRTAWIDRHGKILDTHPDGWEHTIQDDNRKRLYWSWVNPRTGDMIRDTGYVSESL